MPKDTLPWRLLYPNSSWMTRPPSSTVTPFQVDILWFVSQQSFLLHEGPFVAWKNSSNIALSFDEAILEESAVKRDGAVGIIIRSSRKRKAHENYTGLWPNSRQDADCSGAVLFYVVISLRSFYTGFWAKTPQTSDHPPDIIDIAVMKSIWGWWFLTVRYTTKHCLYGSLECFCIITK